MSYDMSLSTYQNQFYYVMIFYHHNFSLLLEYVGNLLRIRYKVEQEHLGGVRSIYAKLWLGSGFNWVQAV